MPCVRRLPLSAHDQKTRAAKLCQEHKQFCWWSDAYERNWKKARIIALEDSVRKFAKIKIPPTFINDFQTQWLKLANQQYSCSKFNVNKSRINSACENVEFYF